MHKESYERMRLVITEFDAEDVIVTSGETPGGDTPGGDTPGGGGNTPPAFTPDTYEMPIGF